jgi:hypothetical protein
MKKTQFVHGIAFCRKAKQLFRLFRLPRNNFFCRKLPILVSTRHIAQLLPGLSNRMLLKFQCVSTQCIASWQYTAYCKLTVHSVLQVDSTQCIASWQYTVYCKLTVHSVLQVDSTECIASWQYTVYCKTVRSVLQVDSTQCIASWQYAVYCKLTVRSVLQVDSTPCTANFHIYRQTSSGSRLTASVLLRFSSG